MCHRAGMGLDMLRTELQRIASAADDEVNAAVSRDDLAEAKRVLVNAQRDLRSLKRDVTDEERATRESFQDARLDASQSGQVVGMFVNAKARGAMARVRAIEKRSISENQAKALRPYADLKSTIDRGILELDRSKSKVAAEVADRRTKPAAAAIVQLPPESPLPEAVPAQWNIDPTERHQHRWWDGRQWTEHVSDNGTASIDPLT